MTTWEMLMLAIGLWLGMGFTCWAVPMWASLPYEKFSGLDPLVLICCLSLGPIAVVLYARHERKHY